jgi:hypothetical protein
MMVVNEMAVEAYRQERCQKAKLKRSMDKDRFEKPLLDNKSPTGAFISGHDLAKCFHRQGLKEGLSRDVCSLNYRGLGNVRALRCSQGPKQIPASWARFCVDILGRTGMVYGEGLEEAIDPKDEAALKKFIGDHTGDYDSMPPHSFMRCYVDDLVCMSVSKEQTMRQCLVEIFSLENPRDLVEEDWARFEASDILDLAGEDNEVTSDGTVVVCNIKVELALSQPQMTEDCYLRRLSERKPESATVLGLEISAGGRQPTQKPTAAVELFSLGCEHGLCNGDGSVVRSDDIMKGDVNHSDSVCGISTRSKGGAPKPVGKRTKSASSQLKCKPAEGQRKGNHWICANKDTFNRIIKALNWDDEAKHGANALSEARARLQRLNPHIQLSSAKNNSQLDAGVRVNLEKSAMDEHQKAITPDPVTPGESGFSLTDEVFNGAEHLKPLFKPEDYLECEDKDVRETYLALKTGKKPKNLPIDGYYLTGDGYLLRLDPVSNRMATVVPTKDAQEELVRLFHHEYGSHPHYRQQVYTMRQIVVWRGMSKMVKNYEKGCECNAWKSRTHYHYGPMELFTRPVEPNVTWHIDFITGLKEVNNYGIGMLGGNKLSCILSIVDAFSGMCWLLPVSDTISAKETGELILRRVMLEDARGLACQIVSDLDQRFIGAAMRHIYTLNGSRMTQTSGYRSTSNGKVERLHRIVWRLLQGNGLDQHKWLDRLPYVVYTLRTDQKETKCGYSPVEIETGLQPRSPVTSTQGLLRLRHTTERDTREHMRELAIIRQEVEEANRAAAEYNKKKFDEKTSTWKDEELLASGKPVWIETTDIDLPIDPLRPTRKMRPRYMGPVFIKRRRRHHTFELDMGNSRHHNIYHISRLKPFLGDASEGVPVDEFPVPDDGNPRTYAEKAKAGEKRKSYVVERILSQRGKPGTGSHMYLIKWKGYIAEKSSWEPAKDVNAPAAVEKYQRELQQQRDYLDGKLQKPEHDDSMRLDADAWSKKDAAICGLGCEMAPDLLDFVCYKQSERLRFHD